MKRYLLILLAACLCQIVIYSCTEEIDLGLNQHEKKLVIEALITDQPGPYFVRLTRTSNSLYTPSIADTSYASHAEIVKNATIIISDNAGNIDTLIPSPYAFYTYSFEKPDSLIGYYTTKNFQGVSGRKYYLKIEVDDKVFQAEADMIPVPDIDTIVFNISPGDPGKEDKVVPLVKMQPTDNNEMYYLFTAQNRPNALHYNIAVFSILKCENNNANLYPLYNETSTEGWHFNFSSDFRDTTQFNVYSLNKKSYDFHKNIIKQFSNDGGAYKPSPSTPQGSFGDEAIGLFQVSSVKTFKTKLDFYYMFKR
ncbi:MAG: DUF4249 family protein [Bacteroidales bacterium]|nr:DUF4249 family protein [Bacteroidales bacterium]